MAAQKEESAPSQKPALSVVADTAMPQHEAAPFSRRTKIKSFIAKAGLGLFLVGGATAIGGYKYISDHTMTQEQMKASSDEAVLESLEAQDTGSELFLGGIGAAAVGAVSIAGVVYTDSRNRDPAPNPVRTPTQQ